MIGLVNLLLNTTPGARRLRGEQPAFSRAIEAAHGADLQPLADALAPVARSGFADMDLVNQGLRRLGVVSNARVQFDAGLLSEEIADRDPAAAFVLAWFGLAAWVVGAGERREVLDDTDGIFDRRWCVLPHAAADAALILGGLYAAAELTGVAQETMRVARHRGLGRRDIRAVDQAIERYGALSRRLVARTELAVRDLADELCDAAEPLRFDLAALLWTLGRVPEARAVQRHGSAIVTRPLARRLVRESLRAIPRDPLLQYVWLELKDRPSLALREHVSLFAVIDHQWNQWWLDGPPAPLGEGPSACYARTLQLTLADSLDQDAADVYLGLYDLLDEMGPTGSPPGWGVAFRLRALRMLVGEHLDLLIDASDAAMISYLESEVDIVAGRCAQSWQQPELPIIGSRLAAPLFELTDRRLGAEADPEALRAAFGSLERPRFGSLRFWLRIAPPPAPPDPSDDLARRLEREQSLIEDLRGASFLTMKPTLPLQFSWADIDSDLSFALRDPGFREAFYSPERARGELDQIERELDGVGRAPTPATIEEVVSVLRTHLDEPHA